MDTDPGIFRRQIEKLSQLDKKCAEVFEKYLKQDVWASNDWELLLRTTGQSLLDPGLTLLIGTHLRPWILELLGRAQFAATKSLQTGGGSELHIALCVALSKLITISRDVQRFALKFFQKSAPPYEKKSIEPVEPSPKRRKKQKLNYTLTERDIIRATYDLLAHMGNDLIHTWKWADLLAYVTHDIEEIRWLVCNCIAVLSKMSEVERESFIIKYVNLEAHHRLSVENGILHNMCMPAILEGEDHIEELLALKHIAIVGGVSLPIFSKKNVKRGHLVTVSSTERNLQGVAIAVSQGHPVLIEGVVGSGKTSVVEHLAAVTGRTVPPLLTKVQLGDQTDSKTLLGTYCCTQVPGEFVWRPGSLTQAVTKGYWLLLEDLDYAPMDVISVLVPLLESRTLPVPGYGNVRAHPAFQLFATRRTLGGSRIVSGCTKLLDKLWTKVTLETLSRSELEHLISSKWPELQSISDRLTATYLMLSAGQHDDDVALESGSGIPDMTAMKLSGRLVSTRDLMKWCSRVNAHLKTSDVTLATRAFQEALDCFCAAVPVLNTRYSFALQIGSYMNSSKAEVDYYCTKYKPEIMHNTNNLKIGQRGNLPKKAVSALSTSKTKNVTFSFTRPASLLLERIAVAVSNYEPVLLVGETGTGKTSTVQYLAQQTKHKLRVINMNQQSDSTDLLGGFKPVEMKTIVSPLRQEFEDLFAATFSSSKNNKFLQHIMVCYVNQRWKDLFALMLHSQEKAINKLKDSVVEDATEEQAAVSVENKDLLSKWKKMRIKIANMKEQVEQAQSALAFAFIEGALVKAVQEGEWVLLDEINLASAETLECLSGLLESESGSLILLERGDNKPVERHPDFRLFACMNPATDVGKKELPAGIRNRFTEFFMDELEDNLDIMILINDYLVKLGPTSKQIQGIKDFYKKVKKRASTSLTDGTGHKPHFSLRTLCRALAVAAKNPCLNFRRSLYESFCLSFLTQLDRTSHPAVVSLIITHVMGIEPSEAESSKKKKLPLDPIPAPNSGKCIEIEGYWVPQGDCEPDSMQNYIITETVKKNLHDLVRVVSIGRFPVLLQGETSVGKTSLITYLARLTGNRCVRINNHEHTDLQEYVGSYAPDENGKLIFKEGILVKAMRRGYWIILDELNLAPTDVLEALNRLLDDNRELFIPETQETVRAHKHFMLFATQNPPGLYGGRKVLSRAFRNRFVELHFDEIPPSELEVILHMRCEVPLSYSKKMVSVLKELQKMRRGSNIFQGKQSFITLRDLFRWAERYRLAPKQEAKFYDWDQHLADEGYLILAGRVRAEEECEDIRKVIEKQMKKKVLKENLFNLTENTSPVTKLYLEQMSTMKGFEHVVWTLDMRRLYILVAKALSFGEPVLLVGETGCGKTTVCQMIAAKNQQDLYTINCHMHTEGTDFLGGLRPVRSHEDDDRLFEWVDGPLILSMRNGGMFLGDEISLADDSVLERLNSVLEPERMLVLAEKGTDEVMNANSPEIIYAEQRFRLIGTMNPGGDYGKKELSPALRNRFTEIWCPKVEIGRISADVINIIEHNVRNDLILTHEDPSSGFGKAMVQFLEHFTKTELGKKCIISIRDILSWVYFINKVTAAPTFLDPGLAYIHGACLILLDGLGSGLTGSSISGWKQLREASLNYLIQQVWQKMGKKPERKTLNETFIGELHLINKNGKFGIEPFVISAGPQKDVNTGMFSFDAPRTCVNLLRLLRGLQLPKPILLEGSPGVGKTSLVMALAKASGNGITRINLSEQTDVSDLFGADLPVEGGKGGQFAWHDGPLLQALRYGNWIVLDELNLASQSVLEGLNACFDHRGEIFVPELGRTFRVEHQTTKIFACQNPQHQGGARKGLPKSFLNRFTQVHVEPLSSSDLEFILRTMYACVPKEIITKMVEYNHLLCQEILVEGSWGHRGGPWELNLRDLFRWCDVMTKHQSTEKYNPGEYVALIYSDRMRTKEDKDNVLALYDRVFGEKFPSYRSVGQFYITGTSLQVGHSFIDRKIDGNDSEEDSSGNLYMIHHQLPVLESLITCVNMNWMALLIGDSGVGKTSVVKLLASVLNKRLLTFTVNSDMDVTELLGGFQQVDFGRELGEAVTDAGTCVWSSVRKQLLDGNFGLAKELLNIWDRLVTAYNSKAVRTTSEEIAHFHNQCDILTELLDTLIEKPPLTDVSFSVKKGKKRMIRHEMNGHDELGAQQKKKKKKVQQNGWFEMNIIPDQVKRLRDFVLKLRERVQVAGGVSGGGTFHWVDSILVKAVRDGDWLLIDGVNVCSASVLDRLNAMLEPGGVLAISERGVVDGAVPSITPHRNFRLFLAMDPQYGEISRAMRNRGLEICPLEAWELSLDIRSLLQQSGLYSPELQNKLTSLHHSVNEALPVYEQLGISHLKRVASVTSHLMQSGFQEEIALMKAAMLVYFRSQGKPDVRDNINKVISNVINATKTTTNIPFPKFENQVMSVRSLKSGSDIAYIKTKGSLLHTYLLSVLYPELSREWTASVLPPPCTVPSDKQQMIQCLTLILSSTPVHDWPLLHTWIAHMSHEIPADLSHLCQLAVAAVHHVHSVAPKQLLKALTQNMNKIHTFDPRHNMQALATEMGNDIGVTESLANKAALWLWRTLSQFCREYHMSTDLKDGSCKVDSMTVLEVSEAVTKGIIGKSSVMHKSVLYLAPVLKSLHEMIISFCSNIQISLSNVEWGSLVAAMRWTDRLVELCDQVVEKSAFHLFVPQLALHWQWVIEELLNRMPNSWRELVPSEVKELINTLQRVFDRQFGPLDKLAIDIRSCTSPAPFTSPFSSDAHSRLVDISTALSPVPGNHRINVFLASVEGREICQTLALLSSEVGALNSYSVMSMDEKLTTIEDKLQKKCFNKDFSHDAFKSGILSLLIQTWPLHDFVALITLLSRREFLDSSHIQSVIARGPGIYKELVACLSGPSIRSSAVINVHSYLALRRCTSSHFTKLYLNYSVGTSEEELEEQISDAKDIYIHPASCQLTYILSAGSNKLNPKSESIIEEVVAGVHVEKVGQLKSVQATLWNNWFSLINPDVSYEASFIKVVIGFLTSTLGSLASVLGILSDCSTEFQDVESASALATKLASSDHKCLSDSMKSQLHVISDLAKKFSPCSDNEEKSFVAAQMAVVLALFQTTFIARMEPVDPAKRSSLLLQYSQEELQDLESYSAFSGWLNYLRGGLGHGSKSMCHPHVPLVEEKCNVLKAEVAQLSQQIAVRPDPPTYHFLLQDIEHFMSTVFLPEKIQSLLDGFVSAKMTCDVPFGIKGRLERLLHSCDNFITKVVQQYPLYRDLIYPLLQTVTLTCESLLLMSVGTNHRAVNLQCGIDLGHCLAKYCSFPPHREPTKPLEFLKERASIIKAASVLLPEEKYPGQVKTVQNIIMRATVLDLVNAIHVNRYLTDHNIELTTELFGQVACIWQQQEEQKALKSEEEENLYRYKPRTLAASETEEEEQEREFKEAFPAYYHEFDDLEGPDLNEPKKVDEPVIDDWEDVPVGSLTDEQMYEMSEWHRIIFTSQIDTSWLSAIDNKAKISNQLISAAMLRLHVLKLIVGNVGAITSNKLDHATVGAHILNNYASCAILTDDQTPSILTPIYDIYQDPNPQEALKVRPLLLPVHERVNELLFQWPDHPSLNLINVVIRRVLAFPLTSPLMRHVVGLETLLDKSQEWEKNAHSRVSLMDQLQPVTRQIIEWRKMELQAWRSCLDAVTQKVSLQGRKWWPHLFNMFQASLTETVSIVEVATTLKKYFETSLLGDFKTRLDLLYAFHCNLTVLEKSKVKNRLLALTWNFYHYYLQFLPQVTANLSKARLPIEKDVKSYVKIARWNDINFFSVRESVVKSQRILHRHMRSWEKTLKSPVSPVLCDTSSELSHDHTGAWDKEHNQEVHALIMPKIPKSPGDVTCFTMLTDKIVLSKLSSFTNRCHSLISKILGKNHYSSNIDSLDEFTVNIISNYQDLQQAATKAESASEKEVRLQQLRNVMQRRRDSLAHLFKYLNILGVSYTRGNSIWDESDIDKCFGSKPVDVNVAHKDIPESKAACEAWSGCVKYLNRSIARHSLLLTSLQQAHKDLGPEIIKRLQGIVCHLFLLARNQNKSVSDLSDHTRELHCILHDIKNVDLNPPPPSAMLNCWEQLHTLNTALNVGISEVNIILNTVSSSSPLLLIEECPEVPDQMKLEEAKCILEDIGKSLPAFVRKYSEYVNHFENGTRLVTPVFIKRLRGAIRRTVEDTEKIKKVISLLSVGDEREFPVTKTLSKWISVWESKKVEVSAFVENSFLEGAKEPQQEVHNVTKNVSVLESCLAYILLAVENIYKRHHLQERETDQSEDGFEKKMIRKGLVEDLEADRKDLHLKQVVCMLKALLKESEREPQLLLMLKATSPLLEQYFCMCESVFVFVVNSNRSLTKFTSILQAIFQHLALKGFCRPQELEEEEAGGEGATSFENSDGTGLGEGEGKKDMSDRLESEDQLESALREGETEESGDQDLPEDEKGVEMSGDFDGKLQDVDQQERDDDDDDDNESGSDDEDHEKQMGETEKGAEQLDKKLWGDEDEDGDDDDDEDKDLNEDDGEGEGEQRESKMVAKDDNISKKEKDKERKEKEKLEEMEDTRQENTMADDGVEYDDNFADPYAGEENNPNDQEEEENLDLDDEMVLDDKDADAEDEEEEGDQFDIPEMGVFPEEERETKEKEEGQEEEEEKDEVEDSSKTDARTDKGNSDHSDDEEKEKEGEDENGEDSSENKPDNRQVGIEEVNDDVEQQQEEESAEASEDKESKSKEAEAAEMDTTEGSKDETKERPKTETGGQREEDKDEEQDEQGQVGEETEEQEGVGESESRTRDESHKGESSALVTKTSASDQADMEKPRKPGETNEDRTLGDNEKSIQHGLMTKEKHRHENREKDETRKNDKEEDSEQKKSSSYEHISKADDHMDAQMVDAGTQEQAQEAPAPADRQDEEKEEDEEMLETPMEVEEEETGVADAEKEALGQAGEKNDDQGRDETVDPQGDGETYMETEGEVILESTVERPPETYFHTLLPEENEEDIENADFDENVEGTRRQIEVAKSQNAEEYSSSWSRQEARVAPMALQLCEQLRLILEPTQSSRLKGDYRTGKRLNMRKVIPYIASEFRKDKIWLRRTQPSKRTYQILVAVDDSESMIDVNAGSLAIESIALVTRALTLLEAGEVGVISFGASTRILHPLDQPFSEAAGSQVLSNLKFDQKVTDFARLLEDSVALLTCSRQSSSHGNPDTAQLLLILSDGQTHTRSKAVKAAVRAARANRIFIVFLVLDAKDNKYSFYDILVYNDGKMTNLVDSFPFPFFLVVRDINTLPDALCTALRQWFELVTADAAH